MLRVGLTGSIATGKSFVSSVLRELGCLVIDADRTARDVVAPGSEGLDAVVQRFGSDILEPDGTLNRATLGARVFGDEAQRLALNAILHPLIIARQNEQLFEWEKIHPDGIAVVDAALLIESGSYKRFSKLIVVYCKPEVQLQRLMARDGLTRSEAEMRIASQLSQEAKMRLADFTIDTSGSFAETRERTELVYNQLRRDSTGP
jgi:dephospho-CoA kinase